MSEKVCVAKRKRSRYFYCRRRTQIPQEDIYYRVFKKELEELASAVLQDSIANIHTQSAPDTIESSANKVKATPYRVV